MNTKEAIEIITDDRNGSRRIDIREADEIIVLLQQGKRYRLMVEEIEKNVFTYGYLNMNGEDFRGMVDLPYYKVEMIKDKYFPKETNEHKEGNE